MRARESCRPSALPLKVGRKPKLTSNKVFEVVRGGSWGNCLLREGRLEERSCQLLLFDARLRSRPERPGPVAGRGRAESRPASLRKSHLCQWRKPDAGAPLTFLMGTRAWTSLLRPSFLCRLSSAATLGTRC